MILHDIYLARYGRSYDPIRTQDRQAFLNELLRFRGELANGGVKTVSPASVNNWLLPEQTIKEPKTAASKRFLHAYMSWAIQRGDVQQDSEISRRVMNALEPYSGNQKRRPLGLYEDAARELTDRGYTYKDIQFLKLNFRKAIEWIDTCHRAKGRRPRVVLTEPPALTGRFAPPALAERLRDKVEELDVREIRILKLAINGLIS